MAKNIKQDKIVIFGDINLRTVCKPVTVFHKGLQNKIDIAKVTLNNHGGGAALAAPQIAILKRFIVINYMDEYIELVNPEIINKSGERKDYEGCLSLPGYFGQVIRANSVTVKYQDRFGQFKEIKRDGAMSKCIQHEMDHLDGILFIDRMTDEFVYNDDTNSKISVKELITLTQKPKE